MELTDLKRETQYFDNILPNEEEVFFKIKMETIWDESMISRKTKSYGDPYNYSNIHYSTIPFPSDIEKIANYINIYLGFMPNNCLINYYYNEFSKMGFHSDQIDILEDNTGVAIISLGNKRTMRFKNKLNPAITFDVLLYPNSLFYMTQKVQELWLHAILSEVGNDSFERISITFRKLRKQIF
ncbi:alpha-ketoglutarate-dependent dioxygenase AlkB [Flavobacterium sp. LPB0248]|uniref:alpha-ketoglutarate-dependent dioxygenase AlkB n=1 Tax=Flavobacterium sp. LPB0248 TaxID=2614441 RepID=UPI0015A67143|nr:alpha-ketoglutarate-dependent dioxygenase AlkB [Flavobacterium sp. LPB0248]QLC66711.1 alpha-ketoglutarate-dependent dioxygenase AlkB [Flavobacterium sp. LPB0248]